MPSILFASLTQRLRSQPLGFTVLWAFKKFDQLVDNGRSGRTRGDVGCDKPLGLQAESNVCLKRGHQLDFAAGL
jgi:hypothetical protein